MKKFLMYVIIVVTCLFLGFTIYYLTQNNENIYIAISKDESIYKNKGESLWLDNLIAWTKPYKSTTLAIVSADENVVVYDEQTKRFDCVGGGFTTLTITPSNDKFGPFVFEVYVGDGSIANPYVIDSAEDLALIGNDPELKFASTNSYILIKDIDLKSYNDGVWTPLPEYSGTFNGAGHILYNLNLTSNSNAGLFSSIASSGFVEDLKFSSAKIEGAFDNVGLVAGVNKGTVGKIEVLSAKITNTSDTGNTGTIVGLNQREVAPAIVNMCSAKADIVAKANAGGLVGLNKSSIILNSRAIVNFETSSTSAKLGGLTGIMASYYDTANDIYYASAIKNSYSVINNVTGTANIGAIVAENSEDTYTGQMFYNTFEGCLYSMSESVSVGAVAVGSNLLTTEAKANMLQKTKEELVEKATYENVGYNFDTVWLINASETASINYDGAYETYKLVAIGKEITEDVMPLLDFLTNVKANLNSNVSTYRVTEDVTIDLGGAYWETIAPYDKEPMLASVIVDEGKFCVIKNFKLKDSNSSFFGYISGNTQVDGITFENVTVESCTAENSAIVATGLLNGATLNNITVKNYTRINSNAKNVGVICGLNRGSITNCAVICDELKELTVKLSESLTSAGSIVGTNDGYVYNCTVDRVKLCVDVSANRNGSINFGGIVGTNSSNVSNGKVLSFYCETTASGVVYAGGVAGYLTVSSRVNKSYSMANINVNTSNSDAYVGGIAGYVSENASIYGCFHESGELKAYYVGGIAGIVYGNASVSYVGECQLTGLEVGGISRRVLGKVTDCYVLAVLNGISSKSVLAGVSVYVGENAYIEHIFSNASFSGDGRYCAETYSSIRSSKLWQGVIDAIGSFNAGTYKNCIILVNNNADVEKRDIGIIFSGDFNFNGDFIKVTYEECTGEVGNYEVFKDKASFDTNVWNFTEGFPTLKDVIVAE